ncbi:MAG: sugar phosphorylase, partial [Candidatus Dadabacteria bacterium]|nr:sugar phosphorylase [Candidatus Dadabacteria bacterium]NIQ16807.1 sugar phosphorylase [Candidatus Dadabacteria bacterium]
MKNTSVTNNIQLDDTNYINLYHKYPDFQTKIEEIPDHVIQKIKSKLAYLYGENNYEWVYSELERILKVHSAYKNDHFINGNLNDNFSENDMFLITYADLIYEKNKKPLRTLLEFASDHLKDIVNTVHILPFFPYSTDKGFSVIDFNQVDPELGTWQDIAELKVDFNLMFDCVFNHVSSKSNWFQEFLGGNKEYEDFFTVFNTTEEISKDHLELIIRPRTTELLTQFKTLNGTKFLWTTFSDDQIDLNYKNPKV